MERHTDLRDFAASIADKIVVTAFGVVVAKIILLEEFLNLAKFPIIQTSRHGAKRETGLSDRKYKPGKEILPACPWN